MTASVPTRAECIARAAPKIAAAWRQLHEAWIEGGQPAVAALSGERAAEQYAKWAAEDEAQSAAGSAA
jgi:hypothetical protein